MRNNIEKLISNELVGDDKIVANKLVEYLRNNNFEFYRDECDCWKNKIYFWVKYKDECICFIAIKDPDEPNNRWTVWSADIDSEYLNDNFVDENLKQVALNNVDECGHCGYSVRPSERRKGYATEMLRLNLQNAKVLGISKFLVTCEEANIASEKTILSNGGIYENTIEVDGIMIKRFWIEIEVQYV